jgi:hypothetical protein
LLYHHFFLVVRVAPLCFDRLPVIIEVVGKIAISGGGEGERRGKERKGKGREGKGRVKATDHEENYHMVSQSFSDQLSQGAMIDTLFSLLGGVLLRQELIEEGGKGPDLNPLGHRVLQVGDHCLALRLREVAAHGVEHVRVARPGQERGKLVELSIGWLRGA